MILNNGLAPPGYGLTQNINCIQDSGIGFATEERFAREDFRVVLAARNEARVNELVKQLTDKGYEAVARTVDSANPEAVTALVRETEADFDGLDVLHYNAARLHKATLQQQAADTFNTDLAVKS
ncbi:TPA: SDR family NAD(P)-dependent oxidoreductase [Kluyvera ascorbata]|nr:SDR family NAD(P)-dependent oxidoreductase [Kluyvera ascorbata]